MTARYNSRIFVVVLKMGAIGMKLMLVLSALMVVLKANAQQAANLSVPPGQTITYLFAANGVDARGNTRLAIDAEALASLRQSNASHAIHLPLATGQSITLIVRRFDVFTPATRYLRAGKNGATEMSPPQLTFLHGDIEGEPGSRAFISLTNNGAGSGFITRGSGTRFQLIADRISGRASGLIVHHDVHALPGFDVACGTIDQHVESAISGGPSTEPQPSGPRMICVAVDADQEFCQMFQSDEDAIAYVGQVIAAVSEIYRRDLNFKLILKFVRIWPEGGEPFGANNLEGFRNYWINNEDLTGLNLVHLFSGRHDMSYGGIAYLADACSDFGFGISGFMLGGFPAPVDLPDLSNWDVNVVAHEMGHNLSAPHTHSLNPPVDNCANGANQRGTIMSYCHTRPGGMLNIDMRMHARNQEGIALQNPHGNCLSYDCNDNNIDDAQDLTDGTSLDSNFNLIPDECEDCNGDGVLNDAEITAGSADVNLNGIPDACEADCNGSGAPDRWECTTNHAIDLNGNLIPDSCEADCDGNAIADHIDIEDATFSDIDRDSGPDVCQDCNGNGIFDWLDIDRQFNLYAGQSAGPVREYHAASGVAIQNLGPSTSYDLAFGSDRQLYVAIWGANKVIRIDVDTNDITDFVPAGSGGLMRPSSVAFGPDGNLYVASQANSSVLRYNGRTGAFIDVFVSPGAGSLQVPWDLAFRPNGNLLATSSNNRVLEFDGATGQFLSIFIDTPTLSGPRGLAMLPTGAWLVVNRTTNLVNRYSASGAYIGKFNDDYPLVSPWGITVGPDGNVYLNSNTSPVRLIEYAAATGQYLRSFVRGDTIVSPTQFAFRPASPNDLNGNHVPDDCDAIGCKADIAPIGKSNGVVDVDDLLLILDSWGPCPDCTGDIAPEALGGDNLVNVDDLLAIINAWGPCE